MASGDEPKDSPSELTATFRHFSTTLGLCLVPKQRDSKLPIYQYWKAEISRYSDWSDQGRFALQRQNNASGWCVITGERSGYVAVVDIDPNDIRKAGDDPVEVYHQIQALAPSQFVISTASGGVHLYYRYPEDVTLRNRKLRAGVDLRAEGGQVVFLNGYNIYEGREADHKGVPNGYTATYELVAGGDYDHIPDMTPELVAWCQSRQQVEQEDEGTPALVGQSESYGLSEAGRTRVLSHLEQPLTAREAVVLECLSFVLNDWTADKTYDQWCQMWMSAHHGANTTAVRDYIMNHPNVHWRDGLDGKRHFMQAFAGHRWREDGYTVASLFWLARRSGWLSATGYEIPNSRVNYTLDVRFISEWIDSVDTLPKRLLLQSQTGTGKTVAIKAVWEKIGKPKAVVLVPTVKLAQELTATLVRLGVPAVVYFDADRRRAHDTSVLIDAQVLVTTLQTFASRVATAGVDMQEYGLVYIEECDQLLTQFARGGGGLYSSHVRESEARNGFRVLHNALAGSEYVWGVDATMSMLSLVAFERMQGVAHPVMFARNAHTVRKAQVSLFQDKLTGYHIIYDALAAGHRVAVPCDTASEAKTIVETLEAVGGLAGKKYILLTRDTERNPQVNSFMLDVDGEAAKYDLIVYNSVMGSGVSIMDTKADVVVQFCSYLTPRMNLQILNRFRTQGEVFCYYRVTESLYTPAARELLTRYNFQLYNEAYLSRLPYVERDELTNTRQELSVMSTADEMLQKRSPRSFFIALLEGDGRRVEEKDFSESSNQMAAAHAQVFANRREVRAEVAKRWAEVERINLDNPATADMDDMTVLCGERHEEIFRELRGNIPTDKTPEEIDATVRMFEGKSFSLAAFARKGVMIERVENLLRDKGRAINTISPHLTLIRVLSTLSSLFDTIDVQIDRDDAALKLKADRFLKRLAEVSEMYDSLIIRNEYKYASILERDKDPVDAAMTFARQLFGMIGLRLRKTRKTWEINNHKQAREFLTWRYGDDIDLSLTYAEVEEQADRNNTAREKYNALNDADREAVMRVWMSEGASFEQAVEIIAGRW